MKMKKKLLFFLLISIFLIGTLNFVLAQRELEVEYPTIPGVEIVPRTVEGTGLPEYVKYIFNFAIWIVGFLAFGALIYGGARYVTSAGNPAALEDARDQIFSGILGLIILLSSYIILTTINPQLVIFEVKELEAVTVKPGPGVWLCKKTIAGFENFMKNPESFTEEEGKEKMEEVEKNCFRLLTKSSLPEGFKNKVTQVYLVEAETHGYGVVLHRDSSFQGNCQVVTESGSVGPALSGTPFFINKTASGEGVTLYEGRDFNEEEGEERFPETGAATAGEYPNINNMEPCYSIKIDEEKEWVAVAFNSGSLNNGWCEVFNESDRNLEDDYVSTFCVPGWQFWRRWPCVRSLQVIRGTVF